MFLFESEVTLRPDKIIHFLKKRFLHLLIGGGLLYWIVFLPLNKIYLNMSGVCIEEGRKLSDEEIIRRVIEDKIADHRPFWQSVDIPGKGVLRVQRIMPATYEEYMLENPNCCRLNTYSRIDNDRIAGLAHRVIVQNINFHYRDEDGRTGSFYIRGTEGMVVSNCGRVMTD